MSKTKTYYIVTFGCQANEADSERIAGWYQQRGWLPAKSKDQADEVVFNTCSVRQSAEDRVVGQIYQLAKKKNKKSASPTIILTGCMTRLHKNYLLGKIPGINEIWPINQFDFNSPTVRQKKGQALVPIMTGCDNFCTYCVVPYARGREQSRPLIDILCEVEQAIKTGSTTIMLLGQNVNSYHKKAKFNLKNSKLKKQVDLLQKKYHNNFAVLLALLNEIPGIAKIKFMSSNPHDFAPGIITALKLPKIDRYLHLALQSGDDEVLRQMNRPYTAKQFLDLIKQIRAAVPAISIGTDIIVGFPGETKTQFKHTVALCRQIGFSKAYISKYSPRPQTTAYQLADNVPYSEKKRRWQILNKLINQT